MLVYEKEEMAVSKLVPESQMQNGDTGIIGPGWSWSGAWVMKCDGNLVVIRNNTPGQEPGHVLPVCGYMVELCDFMVSKVKKD